jgi:bleomycin hydrolase
MAVNLLEVSFEPSPFVPVLTISQIYGVVPQSIYPESLHSSLSSPINNLLKTKLREHSLILRRLSSALHASTSRSLPEDVILATLRAKKEELMKEVYTIMSATLGVPIKPDEMFVWDYYDENSKIGRWEGTPRDFYKEFACKTYPVSSVTRNVSSEDVIRF